MKGGFKRKNTEQRTKLELNTKADSLASLEQEPGRPSDPGSQRAVAGGLHSATSVTTPIEAAEEQPAAETSLRISLALMGILLRVRMLRLVTCFLRAEEQPANAFTKALRRTAWFGTLTKAPFVRSAMRALCREGGREVASARLCRGRADTARATRGVSGGAASATGGVTKSKLKTEEA